MYSIGFSIFSNIIWFFCLSIHYILLTLRFCVWTRCCHNKRHMCTTLEKSVWFLEGEWGLVLIGQDCVNSGLFHKLSNHTNFRLYFFIYVIFYFDNSFTSSTISGSMLTKSLDSHIYLSSYPQFLIMASFINSVVARSSTHTSL
jgi:hypothetical protein